MEISQISLAVELKKYEPFGGKRFHIQLVPVTEEQIKLHPKYKGKDSYEVTLENRGFGELIWFCPVGGSTFSLFFQTVDKDIVLRSQIFWKCDFL